MLVPEMTAKILLSLIAALTISTHWCYSAPLSATKNNQSALSLSSNTGGALSDMIDEQAALSKLLINKLDNGTSRVEFTFGARKNFIVGNYTNFGNQLDVNGLLVKVHPMRACQRKTLGLDSTLAGHIVVVIMDGYVEPFLAGCISPYNQARFARDSLAIGVLFDVQRMRSNSKQKKTEDPPLDIPVVAIGGLQAQSMRAILQRAHKEGHAMEVTIKRNIMEKEQTVEPEDQVKWKEVIPAVSDVGIFFALLVLVIFVFVLILIKINLKPRRTQEDVSLQSLAKCALAKMEIKKYRTNKKPKLSMKRKQDGLLLQQQQLPNAECHLASISLLGSSKRSLSRSTESDTCAVCLEDFRNGQVLRVILCGHEFHKKCVDPWLLQNRTCPLCLFDVVFEKYVGAARSPEDCPATVEQFNAVNPNSNIVSSSSVAGNLGRSTAVVGVLENPVDLATAIHRRSVSEQFWQIGFWEGFGEKRALDFVPRRAGILDNQNCYCSNGRLSSAIPINNCTGVQQRNGENNLPEPAGNPNNDMMTSQFSSTRSICCSSCVNFDSRHRTTAAPIFVKKSTVKQRKRKFQQNSAAVKRLPRRYYANCDCHVTTNGVGRANKRCRHSAKNVQHNNKQILSLDQTFVVDNMQISEGYLSDVSSSLTVTTVKENLHNANVANDNKRTGDKDGCNLSSCESSRS